MFDMVYQQGLANPLMELASGVVGFQRFGIACKRRLVNGY